MKEGHDQALSETALNETQMTKLSWDTVQTLGLNRVTIEKCIKNSFKSYYLEGNFYKEIPVAQLIQFLMIIYY